MSTTLIKLNGTGGDLKEMTTAEEAYIAYQVSAYLASATWTNASVGAIINSTDTNNQPVGTYTNTYYNQAVGTHPASALSTGSTTTTLKQYTAAFSEASLQYPISWESSGSVGIHQMTSAEMNTVCDRILAYIMANEWPGSLRIATATPTNYSLFRSSVFTDTRADGTTVTYNLYKRTTMPTAPTTVRPMRLDGTAGNLKEMTDAEIQESFGPRVINRMISANDRTGRYFFGTSEPTSNGYTGTWATRGTATDTRDTTSEVNYSANYTINRTANFTTVSVLATAVTVYQGSYARTVYRAVRQGYTGTFIGNYVGEYAATLYQSYTGDFIGDFVGNYTGDYVGTTLSSSSTTISTYTLYVRTA